MNWMAVKLIRLCHGLWRSAEMNDESTEFLSDCFLCHAWSHRVFEFLGRIPSHSKLQYHIPEKYMFHSDCFSCSLLSVNPFRTLQLGTQTSERSDKPYLTSARRMKSPEQMYFTRRN